MAYRRKQGNPRSSSTFEDLRVSGGSGEPPPSLAAQAIRASAVHRDSSLSSAYGESAYSRRSPLPNSSEFDDSPKKSSDEPRGGFWSILARKAKAIIEDDHAASQLENTDRNQLQNNDRLTDYSFHHSVSTESHWKNESPTLHKRLDAITSSLNYIGGRVGSALEEGLSAVESRTANIIQETRKLNIRRKEGSPTVQNQTPDAFGFLQMQTDYESQLKASRDVANAMAAKAKLLMRELKTVKADLAFAKERCSQLEEENKILRESHDKGDHHEDDDLVRLQLETLLAEKARLANENSIYARENRFLREIVEYHQLTMQDVVYLNEGIEEVSEVYRVSTTLSHDDTSRSPSPRVNAPSELLPYLEQHSDAHEGSSPSTCGAADPMTAVFVPSLQDAVGAAVVLENADSALFKR